MTKKNEQSEGNEMIIDRPKTISEMSIYAKLLHCRSELRNLDIKKSGYNSYSNFSYYELKDFLGPIMDLCLAYNIFTEISFNNEIATLTITNIDKTEEKVIFTSPMSSAKLTACHEIQNLGAVETYERRYLYITAFEIIEPDVLDATSGKDKAAPKTEAAGAAGNLTEKQVKMLFAKAYKKGYGFDKVKKQVTKLYGIDRVEDLTKAQFKELCDKYDALEDKAEDKAE